MTEGCICPQCGAAYMPRMSGQRYYSGKCGRLYRAAHGHGYPLPSITFTCAECGRTVVTEGGTDKRVRFCSASCEKKYWRHPPENYETRLTNWHSIEEYASWERRTNE